jgi:ABC-type branched-subunit amino acid transport system ATPase component
MQASKRERLNQTNSLSASANAATVPNPEPIIAMRDVVKRYGDTTAVAGVDLTVWPGEIFGILGPNGAGKTTTLEMLEGLRAPTSGELRVAGFDPVTQAEQVHRVIGVQLQSTALFDYLSAAEIIALFANLYGADASPAGRSSVWRWRWRSSTRHASPSSMSPQQASIPRRGARSGAPCRTSVMRVPPWC